MLSFLTEVVPAAIANPTPAAWRVLTKAAYFLGMMAVIGGCVLHLAVLRPVLRRPSVDSADRAAIEHRLGVVLASGGAFFLVALYFQFAALIARAKTPGSTPTTYAHALSPSAMWTYVTAPGKPNQWISAGAVSAIQYLLWALAAIVLMLLWRRSFRTRLTAIVTTALVITFVSHQISLIPMDFGAATAESVVDVVVNHVHVLAVCVWIGGVGTLVALSVFRREVSAAAGAAWAQVWIRFGTMAVMAVGCLVISGMYMAWTLIGSPAELFTTKFGNILLVKVTLVGLILLIGGAHEFVLMPRMVAARAAGESASLLRLAVRVAPRLAAAEAALGLGALTAMTFLNGSARAQAGDADPALSGEVIGLGVLLIVVLAASFVVTAKLSDRLARAHIGGPVPSAN